MDTDTENTDKPIPVLKEEPEYTKCNHDNLTFEHWELNTYYYNFNKDGIWSEDSSLDGKPTGRFEVYCHDCGWARTYTKSTMPRWIIDRVMKANPKVNTLITSGVVSKDNPKG